MDKKNGLLLADFRVLDLTDEKGILCSKILADMGADVITIEKPTGNPARKLGPFYHDEPDIEKSLYWFAYSMNKRSICMIASFFRFKHRAKILPKKNGINRNGAKYPTRRTGRKSSPGNTRRTYHKQTDRLSIQRLNHTRFNIFCLMLSGLDTMVYKKKNRSCGLSFQHDSHAVTCT